jgi:hypothetical protein
MHLGSVERPSFYRKRAVRARKRAIGTHNPEMREAWLRIAGGLEVLGNLADQRRNAKERKPDNLDLFS